MARKRTIITAPNTARRGPLRDPATGRVSGGNPGNKGGPGRPRAEHVNWCRAAVSDPRAEAQVMAVLRDRHHPAFAAMWKVLAERAYGRPTQEHEHTAAVDFNVEDMRARLITRLDRMAAHMADRNGAAAPR